MAVAAALHFVRNDSVVAGMSAPQALLTATVGAGYISWSYSAAAKLNDQMETQVYVSAPPATPPVALVSHRVPQRKIPSAWAHKAL
jgi:hypothetical protein